MANKYIPQEIEPKWQKRWEDDQLYKTIEDPDKPKWYALTMLPYPSGNLHVGHWYAMTPSDAGARFRRMNGYNAFFPPGFDAFGLPAENAAIANNVHPKIWTYKNIEKMREQMKRMGAMWDWDREAISCDPDYYKWSQWFFLRFYEEGLAYREFAPVDWCPSCNTTLAREQVWGEDRRCERCDTPVIKKPLNQWKFAITKFAEPLLEELNNIDWPERVKVMQTNWIGKSTGAEVTFHTEEGDPITVFTTRPDTLWGATFMVLAPEHPLVDKVTTADQREAIDAYKSEAEKQDEIARTAVDKEKTGVFTGGYAINPVNNARIPIWIADYVMMGYGTGAIMAVPAHDQRDFEFAKKFDLEITLVVQPDEGDVKSADDLDEAWPGDGTMVNSGPLDDIPAGKGEGESVDAAVEWLEANGKGTAEVNYRLRDWLISRQRMWGTPIPIIYCDKCGTVPVPYEDLPVELPDDAEFKPTGESPLRSHEGFLNVACPRCGEPAQRDTDTMDTFICSNWYYYAYISPYWKKGETIHRDDMPWDEEKAEYWVPVDQYTGGIEHATMHLLYTRFFTHALHRLEILPFAEPMTRLFNQGMILGPDGEKMSKSRGNVVDPDSVVDEYGADTVRGYLMFIGPWEQGGPWDPKAIEGVSRFLYRVWSVAMDEPNADLAAAQPSADDVRALERKLHQTIIKVTDDVEHFRFNTAIAAMMELNNTLTKAKESAVIGAPVWNEAVTSLILMMAPIFPHISEELWHQMGNETSVHVATWPVADAAKAKDDEITVIVQVNGKVRDKLVVSPETDNATLEEQALGCDGIKKWVDGKSVRKVIVVPNKLVNIVVG